MPAGRLRSKTITAWKLPPLLPSLRMAAGWSSSEPILLKLKTAGIPSYGISGIALDEDDVRAHGKDERVRVSSFYDGVEFYYQYLKALTGK